MDELVQLIAKTYGIAGLIMISPFAAVVFIWRDNIQTRAELKASQEARIADSKAVSETLLKLVGEQSALNKETNLLLERLGDMMTFITNPAQKPR